MGSYMKVTYGNEKISGELFLEKSANSFAVLVATPSDEKDMVNIALSILGSGKKFRSVTVQELGRKAQSAYSRDVVVEIDGEIVRPKQQPLRFSVSMRNGMWNNTLGATLSPQRVLNCKHKLRIIDPDSGLGIVIDDLEGLKKMVRENRRLRFAFK
jgi:hypothetical protein